MALINCKECGKQISSKAKSCPGCGCPIVYSMEERTITIQKTSKEYKAMGCVCFLLLMFFGFLAFVAVVTLNSDLMILSICASVVCLIGLSINSIKIWWNNG